MPRGIGRYPMSDSKLAGDRGVALEVVPPSRDAGCSRSSDTETRREPCSRKLFSGRGRASWARSARGCALRCVRRTPPFSAPGAPAQIQNAAHYLRGTSMGPGRGVRSPVACVQVLGRRYLQVPAGVAVASLPRPPADHGIALPVWCAPVRRHGPACPGTAAGLGPAKLVEDDLPDHAGAHLLSASRGRDGQVGMCAQMISDLAGGRRPFVAPGPGTGG